AADVDFPTIALSAAGGTIHKNSIASKHGRRLVMRSWGVVLLLVYTASLQAADLGVADFKLQDFRGAEHKLSDWQDKKLVVIAFLGTECPLAKLYGSRLAELAKEYEPKGVQFVGINSNKQDTLRKIAHYAAQHKIEFPLLKDS